MITVPAVNFIWALDGPDKLALLATGLAIGTTHVTQTRLHRYQANQRALVHCANRGGAIQQGLYFLGNYCRNQQALNQDCDWKLDKPTCKRSSTRAYSRHMTHGYSLSHLLESDGGDFSVCRMTQ